MTIIHQPCNAKVTSSAAEENKELLKAEGGRPGDWGFCTKCHKRVNHLFMRNGALVFSEEVITSWLNKK